MREVIRLAITLKRQRLITDYAIGGGVATIFYTEPIFTNDVDVFIALAQNQQLTNLQPIYDFIKKKNYKWEGDHIRVGTYLVQILVGGELETEAVMNANGLSYSDTKCRVMSAEYLVAIFTKLARTKDIYRIQLLLEKVHRERLRDILERYDLLDRFTKITGKQI